MINYVVFAMYKRGSMRYLEVDSKNLKDAIVEARKDYRCPNLMLVDMFGNQYIIRVNGSDRFPPRKNRCVTIFNRSCAGCSFKSKWGSGCLH